jgi:hypothetical protein
MIRRNTRRLALLTVLMSLLASALAVVPASSALPTWTVTSSPNVGARTNELRGVACTAPTSCVAVGFSVNSAGIRRALAEQRQGSSWSLMNAVNVGTGANVLAGVACPASTTCVAVGSSITGGALAPLIETWNGTGWTVVPSPNPGAAGSELSAVSCSDVSACVAVGDMVDALGVVRTLVEQWDGATWTVVTVPSPGPAAAVLDGVSCPSPTDCVAVGYQTDFGGNQHTLVESTSGAGWSVVASPAPSYNSVLLGVTCTSTTNCVAVGWQASALGHQLIETWHGVAWTAPVITKPAGARTASLDSISCTTAARCLAVGHSNNGAVTRTLVQAWNGSSWPIQTSPNPGTVDSSLVGVSCATATSCVAVGHRAASLVASTLVVTGTAAPDVTAPTETISTPAAGSYLVRGQSATANYRCVDETGGSGAVSCAGTVANGAPVDTSVSGAQTFSVTGTDGAGNSATANAGFTVVDPVVASADVVAGGSVTTDGGVGPTPTLPIVTTVTSPNAGTVGIDQDALTIGTPSGYRLLGVEVGVSAPPASVDAPIALTFDVDAAMLPSGTTASNLALLDDAALVPECTDATTLPAGVGACITARGDAPSGGGDGRVSVLTDSGGTWNFATGAATLPAMSIVNTGVAEGNAGTKVLPFTVSLSAPSVHPVTVDYATTAGSAHASSDFVMTQGTLTFAPGQVQAIAPVTILGDTTVEPNEHFTIGLSSVAGATIKTSSAQGTIIDDDATVPGTPTAVRVVAGNASAELQWNAPANGGRPIIGYIVTPYVNGVADPPRTFTNAATNETVTGLANATSYTFDVAATNAVGTGARSAVTAAAVVGAPAAPEVTAVGSSGRAALTWTVDDNGSAVMSYVVQVAKAGVPQPALTHTLTCTQPCAPPTSWNVTSLANGSIYTFSVVANNDRGTGQTGATKILVSPTPTRPAVMGTPTPHAGTGEITLTWTAPAAGTASITSYEIAVYFNGTKKTTVIASGFQTRRVFPFVVVGGYYAYAIQARNVVGLGPSSGLSVAVTPT